MMIAGLVRDDVRQAISQFPGLGSIPVLGTLFRSRDFERNESELVIIITPYLAKPVARNDLAKPDDINPPSDGAVCFWPSIASTAPCRPTSPTPLSRRCRLHLQVSGERTCLSQH
jgi:Flp pilus assembly secretin CpaC